MTFHIRRLEIGFQQSTSDTTGLRGSAIFLVSNDCGWTFLNRGNRTVRKYCRDLGEFRTGNQFDFEGHCADPNTNANCSLAVLRVLFSDEVAERMLIRGVFPFVTIFDRDIQIFKSDFQFTNEAVWKIGILCKVSWTYQESRDLLWSRWQQPWNCNHYLCSFRRCYKGCCCSQWPSR